jgi:hypothetical protein
MRGGLSPSPPRKVLFPIEIQHLTVMLLPVLTRIPWVANRPPSDRRYAHRLGAV